MRGAATLPDDAQEPSDAWIDFDEIPDLAEALFDPDKCRPPYGAMVQRVVKFRESENFTWRLPAAAAKVLCEALYGDASTLWAMLLYLCGLAHLGCRVGVASLSYGALSVP